MADAALKQHFDSCARYNAWANQRLYDAAAALSDADYRADRGAFFKSVHGTLNHLLVTDYVWMHRFLGPQPHDPALLSEGAPPSRLDAILHDDFASLRAAREMEDARIVRYVTGLTPEGLAQVLSYRRVSTPDAMRQPLVEALAHWFNHQTHHRGQAHALLTTFGQPCPVLDMLEFQRAQARADVA
jgi:uncharacterized damage-inducible protein DinB